ncbi:MAG: Uncharacterised protein [Flavobacteriia bacterium]|nr:MAG: Uncharacterised protein [Flavobacteriia bacterium]
MKREHYLSIMRDFFHQVHTRLPKGRGMGAELGDLLGKSENTIYRKVRGEIGIPVEEYIVIARHFGVELPLFEDQKNMRFSRNCNFSQPTEAQKAYQDLRFWLNRITHDSDAQLIVISPYLSPLHFLNDRNIKALLLWEWIGQFRFSSYEDMMKSQHFPYNFDQLQSQLLSTLRRCPITEFLHKDGLKIHLARIGKAIKAHFISTEDATAILNALAGHLSDMERSAEKGSNALGQRYNLYLLDEQCAHSLFLHYSSGHVNGVMLNTGRGNFLETDSSNYCETVLPILTDLKENSSIISGCNKTQRTELFQHYRMQINKMKRGLKAKAA